MTRTRSRKLKIYLQRLLPFVALASQSQPLTTASAQSQPPKQHLVCNIGYTLKQCREAMDVLRQVIAKYPASDVGEWTWVLVRPEDWRHVLLSRRLSPDRVPAFSILPKRVTFFEGALVTKVSLRGFQLRKLWRMPTEDLLDLAVRHELAHARCNERDEAVADRGAIALKAGKPLSCPAALTAEGRAGESGKGR